MATLSAARNITCGSCPDLLPPDERASAESTYDRRLQSARLFVQRLNHDAMPAN
jgi:hypothetical protein